ncbi:lyase family protein [Lysinibacillus sp. MHQ-1]|nr:lyase family protein [Lysinibacillus sp. MHQ-1]
MSACSTSIKLLTVAVWGAAALTTTGFNINRERMRDLLAFDDIIENAWDAVAGADYIAEAASIVQLAALNLGRTSQDFFIMGYPGVQCLHSRKSICSNKLYYAPKA